MAEKVSLLQENLQAEPVTLQDLPPELQARYVGKTGRYRLLVYPAEDIWDFQALARFVNDVRSVDPRGVHRARDRMPWATGESVLCRVDG